MNTFHFVGLRAGLLPKMFYFGVLMPFLCALLESRAEPLTAARRYKPVIQVTEEIDINDITFTTSAPEFENAFSHKAVAHYKPEGPTKGSFGRFADTPHVHYKNSYGAVPPPLDKLYGTGLPPAIPSVKYKPHKVLRLQDGYRPVSYKPKIHEKSKFVPFDPATTFGGPETPKQKLPQFSTRPPAKASTRTTTSFLPQENKNFVPSPTFSPTVLALINNENHKFPERPDVSSFPGQTSTVDWPKPSPKIIKTGRKIPDSHHRESSGGDFPRAPEKLEENLNPRPPYKESPQQSESFLSEISAVHKGTANHLDEIADSLDLKTGERVEFQMYGMDGPQSYKFGFDTGKGHNRHFRFEERDNAGKVKGHYGYLDEDGKMRIMKYEADPVTGFHAGPVEFSPDDN